MRVRGLFSVIGLLVVTGVAWAEDTRLQVKDFAWGLQLQAQEEKALYRLPVPRAVYDGVTRTDLGDLAVFNAQGQQVPHDLTIPSPEEMAKVERRSVSLFPLYGRQDDTLQTLAIELTRQLDAGQLKLKSNGTYRGQHQVLRGHILTLREADEQQSVTALQLQWQASNKGFVEHLRVEQSNDLSRWRLVKADAVIADLQHGGEQLRQDRIQFTGVTSRYLRLIPTGKAPAVILTQAQVELEAAKQSRPAQHMGLERVVAGAQVGEYLFELPPALPITRINIIPRETNSFVRVRLFSKARPDEQWIQRGVGLIHNLMAEGTVVQQTALTVGTVQAQYWRLAVDMRGGGFGAHIPQITVSWIPHDVLFLARGEGPFVLAYGSARSAIGLKSGRLQQLGQSRNGSLVGEDIQPGAPFVLAGRSVLEAAHEIAWKQWLLWTVLILASLLLVAMAWSTFRQMGR